MKKGYFINKLLGVVFMKNQARCFSAKRFTAVLLLLAILGLYGCVSYTILRHGEQMTVIVESGDISYSALENLAMGTIAKLTAGKCVRITDGQSMANISSINGGVVSNNYVVKKYVTPCD